MKVYYFPPFIHCPACSQPMLQIEPLPADKVQKWTNIVCMNYYAKTGSEPGGIYGDRKCDNYDKILRLEAIEIECEEVKE